MKILVVDDHALIREALHGVLRDLRPDAEVMEASTCGQAMQVLGEDTEIELILLDLSLPDGDGFAMLAELRERYPGVSVVVLSAFQERDNVLKALAYGALGFIPKSAQGSVMRSALQLVFAGGIYVPPEVLNGLDLTHAEPAHEALVAGLKKASPGDLGLTERQIEVLALMMQGKSNKAICRSLDLAEATVRNHVSAILKALKVSNRTEAVITATELGWKLQRPLKL